MSLTLLTPVDVTFAATIFTLLLYFLYKRGLIYTKKAANCDFDVFYATESGTAEDFAFRLGSSISNITSGVTRVVNLRKFSPDLLSYTKHTISIFLLATYGDGDPPNSAVCFNNWLTACDGCLSNIYYMVFGLGDSGYLRFNEFAKHIDGLLHKHGAVRLHQLGLGDAGRNTEADFRAWEICAYQALSKHLGLPEICPNIGTVHETVPKILRLSPEEINKLGGSFCGEPRRMLSYKFNSPPYSAENPFLATVVDTNNLFRNTDRMCHLVVLNFEKSQIKYAAGDHLAILPSNPAYLVENLCSLLEVDPNQCFHISIPSVSKYHSFQRQRFPTPCSIQTAFTHYLDITMPVRFDLLEALSKCAVSNEEKQFLEKMSSRTETGNDTYEKWILASRRNIVDVLQDLPSCRPNVDLLLILLPRLQPRYYSISSSPRLHPDKVHLVVGVVEHKSVAGGQRKGVASGMLTDLKPEKSQVPVFLRRSTFRLPRSPLTPVIMIAAGTGIAPFIGFIEERKFMKLKGARLGEALLFYGCRRHDEDFLFPDVLNAAVREGLLSQLKTAFSREQSHKIYVQHRMRDCAATIWRLLHLEKAHLYVCGDSRRMSRDVRDSLKAIVAEHGQLNDLAATAYMDDLRSIGRCIFEAWT